VGDLFAGSRRIEQPCEAIGHRRFREGRAGAAHRTAGDGAIGPAATGTRKRARTSAALRAFSEIHESRVTYYLVYATEYLLTSEGTEIRQNRHFAAIEAGMSALADDGRAAEPFLCGVLGAAGRAARQLRRAQGLNVCRYGTHGSASRASRTGLYTVPFFSRRAQRPRCGASAWSCIERRAASDFLQPVDGQMLSGLGGKSDWCRAWGARMPSGRVGGGFLMAHTSLSTCSRRSAACRGNPYAPGSSTTNTPGGQYARPKPRHPVALSPQPAEHLFHHG